jgi:hypothetical protein
MQKYTSWTKLHIKDTLFDFFPFKMSLFVVHSSSLNWWGGGGDKNLSLCRFKYSCCDFCCGFEQGEGTYLPNNNKPLAYWFSSQMNSTFLYWLPFKVKATYQPIMNNTTWSFGANYMH